jgi:hypothetical protein
MDETKKSEPQKAELKAGMFRRRPAFVPKKIEPKIETMDVPAKAMVEPTAVVLEDPLPVPPPAAPALAPAASAPVKAEVEPPALPSNVVAARKHDSIMSQRTAGARKYFR